MTVYEPEVVDLGWNLVQHYLEATHPKDTAEHGTQDSHPFITSNKQLGDTQNAILIPIDEYIASDLAAHWEHVYLSWVDNKSQILGIVFLSSLSPLCREFDQEDEVDFETLQLLDEYWKKKVEEQYGTE